MTGHTTMLATSVVVVLALIMAYLLGCAVANRKNADRMADAQRRVDRLAKIAKGARQ